MTENNAERLDQLHIGCAGWSLPKEYTAAFPAGGTHLTRYATRFAAVEINSSFYRPHRPATYARWVASVPQGFRFAVKVPKVVTHERRLADVDDVVEDFVAEVSQLGHKLGPLLVQLPPSLSFVAGLAENLFAALRDRFDGDVVLEPRHESWFQRAATQLMRAYRVARVAADPAVVPAAAAPDGWDGIVYYRLHGSPKVYYSAYSDEYLGHLAKTLISAARSATVWCIFDNTALGAATGNALDLLGRVSRNAP